MKDENVVIIGAYGQLGKALLARFPKARAVDRDSLDITDAAAVEAFDWSGAEYILNAAAYTNVDGAETAEGRVLAWQINASAVANLARLAQARNLTLVHISSDYVFDGTHESHVETEPFSPLGVYAQTKAAGDLIVGVVPKHYVVRVSWLIGDGPNFVRTMAGLAAKNISPKVVADQIGRLTFTPQLVEAVEHLLTKQAPYGTYHLSGGGEPASWADITREIFKLLGRDDLTVTDQTTADYFTGKPEASPRPLNSTLELGKIEATGFTVHDWRADLKDYVATLTAAEA